MSYIKYKPSESELKEIKSNYWEVWEGLPVILFESVRSVAGDALKYDKNGNYFWIPTNALNSFRNNPESIFLTRMEKCSKGKIIARWVNSAEGSLEDTIKKAVKLNQNQIDETREKVREEVREEVMQNI